MNIIAPGSLEPRNPRLALDELRQVVRLTPLISIDLVLRDEADRMLLGWRCNRPARHTWFVPGGRVGKNETRAAAFLRLTEMELGRSFAIESARFLGVFEHFYPDNFADAPGFGTHYLVLAYALRQNAKNLLLPPDQHDGYLWLSDAEILIRDDVHANTKAYCGL
jgi:colanic acid biosynthesis protein WcaH